LVEVDDPDQEASLTVDTVAEDPKLAELPATIVELAEALQDPKQVDDDMMTLVEVDGSDQEVTLTEETVAGDDKPAKVLEVLQDMVEVLQEEANDTTKPTKDQDKVPKLTKLECKPPPKFPPCSSLPRDAKNSSTTLSNPLLRVDSIDDPKIGFKSPISFTSYGFFDNYLKEST
jgi:hypothetical protein